MSYLSKINMYLINGLVNICLAFFCYFSIFFADNVGFALDNAESNLVETSYINGWENTDSSIQGALKFHLQPGFLTYWKNPGSLGFKPHFDWSKSLNVKKVTFDWPIPRLFEKFDTQIIGYEHELILPIKIVPLDNSLPMTLHIDLSFGICSDICLPMQKKVLRIISNNFTETQKQIVKEAIGKSRLNKYSEEVISSNCQITKEKNKFLVKTSTDFKSEIEKNTFIFPDYVTDNFTISNQTIVTKKKRLSLVLNLSSDTHEQILERNSIRILVVKPEYGIELQPCS